MKSKGGNRFCGRCGHIYNWREGSRIPSLGCGAKHREVALNRAFPMPEAGKPGSAAEVKLATNVTDDDLPYEGQEEGRNCRAVATTHGMIESVKKSINMDNVEALMSMEEAWRPAFNDRVEQVMPQYKEQCRNLEVENDSALPLKSFDVGAVKTWVQTSTEAPRVARGGHHRS